jgi:hypothetical protein
VFQRESYIAHVLEIGRLTPVLPALSNHAMYQVLMFAMNLALVANNIGLMWGRRIATLTTVLMVGIYRTHEALEAAWKYFILGSVGIALALFGTILVYMAARRSSAKAWRRWCGRAGRPRREFDPALLNLAFVFLLAGLRHQGRARAAARLAARCPCGRSDANLGRALRPLLQRRALRAAALQDAAGAQTRRRSRPAR